MATKYLRDFSERETDGIELCASCGHHDLLHAGQGCHAGKNGRPYRDNAYPERSFKELRDLCEVCWCREFTPDPVKGREQRLRWSDPETLKREAIHALNDSDPRIARRSLEQYIDRTAMGKNRDAVWVESIEHRIAQFEQADSPQSTPRSSATENITP
jgi:hypothetical protein